jgi:hypothetical protein
VLKNLLGFAVRVIDISNRSGLLLSKPLNGGQSLLPDGHIKVFRRANFQDELQKVGDDWLQKQKCGALQKVSSSY